MPLVNIDDLASNATDVKRVSRAARRLAVILAVVGITLILVGGPRIGGAALIFASLVAVMGWIVYPRAIKAAERHTD